MRQDSPSRIRPPAPTRRAGFGPSVVLSYLLMFGLLWALIDKAGIWNVLANTRLLDLLIEVGVIRYHDLHIGFVAGVPDHKYFLMSQDPVDLRILGIAVAIYFLYWGLRAWLFHRAARFAGVAGTAREHVRARLYGLGWSRFVPWRFGDAVTEDALVARGADPNRIRQAFSVIDVLTLVFQIGLFWVIGLIFTGYGELLGQTLWALIILAATLVIARGAGILPWGPAGFRASFAGTWRGLADRPGEAARLGGLAALVKLLDDLTPFLIAMAFTAEHVIMSVPFYMIQVAVVCGYIATRVQLTPMGIGQWEWAFAMTLYVGGVGFPEAATIALLDSFVRHSTGLTTFLFVRFRGDGVPASGASALRRFTGEAAPQPAEPSAPPPPRPATATAATEPSGGAA